MGRVLPFLILRWLLGRLAHSEIIYRTNEGAKEHALNEYVWTPVRLDWPKGGQIRGEGGPLHEGLTKL